MLFKSSVVCLFVLIVFNYALRFVDFSKVVPQNMWQENFVKLQNFVYYNNKAENIILGSSLTMIGVSELNENYCNLAAGGGNPFTGLEIIKKTKMTPKRIYIETNHLLINLLEDKYTGSLFLPVFYELRKHFKVMQEKNQPFSIMGSYLVDKFKNKHTVNNLVKNSKQIPPSRIAEKSQDIFEKKMLGFKKIYENSTPVLPLINQNIMKLNDYIKHFSKTKTELIFFEMPIDCSLRYSQVPTVSRIKMDSICKTNVFCTLPSDSCNKYSTSDGAHLEAKSKILYSDFFYRSIAQSVKE